MPLERAVIKIHGIVQGVGFRPFIHKLVRFRSLSGYIANTSSGVELELEGERADLESFIRELPEKAPKLAVIEKIEYSFSEELCGFEGFEIRASVTEETRNTLISPDICICDDCLRELLDPDDRRFRYPFINCTNCGPRFTIVKDVPYDRAKTSMSEFPMCPDCDREYHDIENRRYHAQPDCCPDCGPEVFFLSAADRNAETFRGNDAIKEARRRLKAGEIVAVKGLGGIHLACMADNAETTELLRKRKQRDEKPFAVMCRDVDAARKICVVSPEEEKILTGFRRPIVLLKKKHPGFGHLSENGFIGVMLPYTPLHYLLFGDDIDTLVMTSANLSDTPIMYKNDEALEKLKDIADGFLLHNREIQTRCDDSLCWVLNGREYFARRSRGYAPFPVSVAGLELPPVLACGAEQKASFALSKGSYVFPSQHIGDLKNIETLESYRQQISHFEKLFDIKPELLACDHHPDYLSTQYAEEESERRGIQLVRVQHHHAHLASCMADNGLNGKAIGLVWDGTGLGTDGTVWGGECLIGDFSDFERFSHILPIALPGGDICTRETRRIAVSLLEASGCDPSWFDDSGILTEMLNKNVNCPRSSGMGRLFDGFSSILGIKSFCSYEGQGAVLLEAAAAEGVTEIMPYEFIRDGEFPVFDWRPAVRFTLGEIRKGREIPALAAMFMNTLVSMAVDTCVMAREYSAVGDVCLSGGSFQNMYIMSRLPGRLEEKGFKVFTHSRVSPNDEGLSLGQLMIAREFAGIK